MAKPTYSSSRNPEDFKQALMFHLDRLSSLSAGLVEIPTDSIASQYEFALNHLEALLIPYTLGDKTDMELMDKFNADINDKRLSKMELQSRAYEDVAVLNYFNTLNEKLKMMVKIMYNHKLLPDKIEYRDIGKDDFEDT